MRRQIEQLRPSAEGVGRGLDEHVHVEEVDGALARVVVVLPAARLAAVPPQPVVHILLNL